LSSNNLSVEFHSEFDRATFPIPSHPIPAAAVLFLRAQQPRGKENGSRRWHKVARLILSCNLSSQCRIFYDIRTISNDDVKTLQRRVKVKQTQKQTFFSWATLSSSPDAIFFARPFHSASYYLSGLARATTAAAAADEDEEDALILLCAPSLSFEMEINAFPPYPAATDSLRS
jgi:hypothetical protein